MRGRFMLEAIAGQPQGIQSTSKGDESVLKIWWRHQEGEENEASL
jgi:hypothetical protein